MNLRARLERWREDFGGDRMLIVTGLLVALFVIIASRDITRPFYGIHGYAEAHSAWCARSHLNYGLGYTQGLCTTAVGNPPQMSSSRYIDHPPLPTLLDAVAMKVFGINEWAIRLTALLVYASCLPFLLCLLRRLFDDGTATLAVLLYVLFPITGYFARFPGIFWTLPLILASWWSYLALIGALRAIAGGQRRHLWILCGALFLQIQLNWIGTFYAAAIGSHYVVHCLCLRRRPERAMFLVLLLSPVVSFIINLLVLLAADAWDYYRLIDLYEFRSTVMGARPDRTPMAWFLQQWQFLQLNYTLPVLALVLAYLGGSVSSRIEWLYRRVAGGAPRSGILRSFPHAWLFVAPALLNMAVFTESFWVHQFQYLPFSIGIAIMAALAILRARDALIKKRLRLTADLAMLGILALVFGFCASGLNFYYGGRHFPPDVLKMFERLKGQIPSDQALLSYFSYFYQDSPYKAPFIRPEVAWSLDRQIVVATTVAEVDRLASEGKFSFYLVDVPPAPESMVEELKARYPYELFKGSAYEADPRFITYDHSDRFLFDLRHPVERQLQR